MKEFYEKWRDEGTLHVSRGKNHLYPAHFHINPEILVVNQGGYEITVSGEKYRLFDGDIAFIDSYETHSYDQIFSSPLPDDLVIIPPYSSVSRYIMRGGDRRIKDPVLRDPALASEILSLAEKYLAESISPEVREAALGLIFSMIFERLEFCEFKKGSEADLVRRILSYIQENFRSDISRSSIAQKLGYTEAHISRIFHAAVGRGLSEYINGLRLSYIDTRLLDGEKHSVTELIFEAGFGSVETYYRARKRAKNSNILPNEADFWVKNE